MRIFQCYVSCCSCIPLLFRFTEANSFLLWATPTSIYYFPLSNNLSDPKFSSEAQLLPISHHGDITAVAYNLRDESIVWLDGNTSTLHRYVYATVM